jgi:type I restriction enzyme S subunit
VSRFRRYPSYRVSSVPWAPSLPSDWRETTVRRLSTIFAGGTPDRTNSDYWIDGVVPWLNSGSVNNGVITSPSELITDAAVAAGVTRWAPPGSVLVALAGQGKTKGMAARLEISSTFNQSMAAIVPRSEVLDHRYLQFWLIANYQPIRNLAGGDLRDGLNLQHIGSIKIPLPHISEQVAIADFLDRETANIDAFILDQERLIALLAERRAATVDYHTSKVNVERRVPVRRIITSLSQGWSPNCENFSAGADEWGVLKVSCVNGGRFRPERNKALLPGVEPQPEFAVASGDVLISRGNTRDLVGSAALVDANHPKLLLSDLLYKLRPDCTRVTASYLVAALSSREARRQLESSAKGTSSSMQKLSQGDILNVKIALPPISEQLIITTRLEQAAADMDAAAADAHHSIALSRERRRALISTAVTGKIDLRRTV